MGATLKWLLLGLGALAMGCEGDIQLGDPNCTLAIQAPGSSGASFDARGGIGSIRLVPTEPRQCRADAKSDKPWLKIAVIDFSQADVLVDVGYSVESNPSSIPRTGTITITNGTSSSWKLEYLVDQAGLPCDAVLAPLSMDFPASAGSGSVAVTLAPDCPWTATTTFNWIILAPGTSGNGSGSFNYSVLANPGPARIGSIIVVDKSFSVTQAGAPTCSFSISPTSASFTKSGGTGTVTVTAPSGCTWTATVSAGSPPFITILSPSGGGGSGNGTVTYQVTTNGTGVQRTGTITIGGQTLTVVQSP